MKSVGAFIELNATDLIGHLSCRHLTQLDLAVAMGRAPGPKKYRDALLEVLWERGLAHERDYVEHMEQAGLDVVQMEGVGIEGKQLTDTLDAMRRGAQVIVQGALADGRWVGRPDVLRRIERPSALGPWSYEVIDTKLARETKGGTILQLCLYSDLLSTAQGLVPEQMYIVSPWSEFEPQAFRTSDYAAYYRLVKARLEAAVGGEAQESTYPEPKEHCDICRWRLDCDARRRADDHLSLVAGISRLQIKELNNRSIYTTKAL